MTLERFSTKKIIYFIKNICVIDVLESDWWFDSPEARDNERIKQLDLLCTIDPNDNIIYQQEALQLDRDIQIKKLVKRVDESKIFVDKKSIVNLLEVSLVTDYKRFEEYKIIAEELVNEKVYSMDELKGDTKSSTNKNKFKYKNKTFDLFTSLFSEILDCFAIHEKYGLDHFLSVRVRHGVLGSELRAVFESDNLITKKSEDGYLKNDYWIKKLNLIENQRINLDCVFKKLSKNIDDIISDVLKNWIQVFPWSKIDIFPYLTSKSNSSFYYYFDYNTIIAIYDKLKHHDNLIDFIDSVFLVFEYRTHTLLSAFRKRIEDELKPSLLASLDDLEEDLNNMQVNEPRLSSAINACRSELNKKLLQITNWFRLSDELSPDNFDLDSLIHTCTNILNNRHNLNLNAYYIKNDIEANYEGKYFLQFVDGILIILGNIIKHTPENIQSTKIELLEENTRKIILISNDLKKDEDIDEIKRKIALSESSDALRKEGGTGIPKLKKILAHDLKSLNPDLEFNIKDNRFTVKITMD